MQLLAEDVSILAFTPDDGTESAAIKLVHRTARHEVINNQTDSQWHNLRFAVKEMLGLLNPNPDHIPIPKLMLYDDVRVSLPQSVHEGRITQLSWDFKRSEWKFFVQCPNKAVSTWYVSADLDVLEQDDD